MEIDATAEVRIAAAPETVFDYTQDWSRRHEWDPEVLGAELVGTAPRRVRVRSRRGATFVLAYGVDERPTHVAVASESLEGGGPVAAIGGAAEYVPDGDGTVFRLTMSVRLGGGMTARMIAPMARMELEQAVRRAVANARTQLEAG